MNTVNMVNNSDVAVSNPCVRGGKNLITFQNEGQHHIILSYKMPFGIPHSYCIRFVRPEWYHLRFCVIADHHPEEIIEALDKLEEAAKEAGIELPA